MKIELRFDTNNGYYYVTDGLLKFRITLSKRYMHRTTQKIVEDFYWSKVDQLTKGNNDE